MKRFFAAFRAHAAVFMSTNMLVVFLLLVLIESSAMSVIYTTYQNRVLFSQLESLKDNAEEMQVEWHQLLLEQSTLASFNRVVEVAQTNLNMKIPDPHTVVVLRQP